MTPTLSRGYAKGWATRQHTNAFASGALLASYHDTDTYFALEDWLGTKRAEISAGGLIANYRSLPYGNGMATIGSAPDATEHHFTGKERDSESGNDYFGARYYASSMGRFMSPDWSTKVAPVPYAKLDNPQSLNLYAYVGNNPLVRIDPDGHYVCSGTKDQCAQIQTALNLGKAAVKDLRADSKQGKAIQKVLDFYGAAGKKNGVNVSFETMKPGQTGSASMGKDGSINLKFDLTQINASGSHSTQPGASMFGERVATVVHEGTHGVDERRWGHNPTTDQQEDWTEHNAYRNESYSVTGLGWFSANGQFYPGMSDKDREAAIDVDAKSSDAAAKQP
jgi:RHS repeat-associated protein